MRIKTAAMHSEKQIRKSQDPSQYDTGLTPCIISNRWRFSERSSTSAEARLEPHHGGREVRLDQQYASFATCRRGLTLVAADWRRWAG